MYPNYYVLRAADPDELARQVNQALETGRAIPQGGMCQSAHNRWWYQAMIAREIVKSLPRPRDR